MAVLTFRFLSALGLLVLASCVRADPSHCANLNGDATCAELGSAAFCSSCEGANHGCVQASPSGDCAAPGQPPDVASSESTEGVPEPTSASSTDGECLAEGLNDACRSETPYCLDGTCVDCGVEGFSCPEAANPTCVEPWGLCAACSPWDMDSDCADQWCGDDFECGGCTRHGQCPESACDLANGVCLPSDRVFYVDNSVCPEEGEGTLDSPLCSLAAAADLIGRDESGTVVLVRGDNYDERLNLSADGPRTVAVRGMGRPTFGGGSHSIEVAAGSRLYLSGAVVIGASESAVRCRTSARAWFDDVDFSNNAMGIDAEGCRVNLRRSRIFSTDGDGILLEGGSHLRMESSAIINNGNGSAETVAIRSNASTFELSYSTIVGNDAPLGPGGVPPRSSIFCSGGMAGPIRNSVVVAPGLESVSCPWATVEHSFVDTPGMEATESVLASNWDETWFQDLPGHDVHVRNPSSNPFADVASWTLEDPQRDLDGSSREAYPGKRGFAGADEP